MRLVVVITVYTARRNNTDRRLLRFHRPDLDARRLGTPESS
ncbi:hypothetical protein LTSEUGA_2664 [Salmonella enterica subsp. enterica serovar Uganda str. R8-3404]|uniref:Uncharacterized protein n=1 Tax=Salmonella enterica subsp. enterica serovar Uganda str. R8-3404 TaxID=913083 RepID=A0A6C8H3M3_SALET|nr:hypothetical protein LTSEUGA_2664 [Salmonella enterica subsp. enterica serovar Uganda str. R8-3404]